MKTLEQILGNWHHLLYRDLDASYFLSLRDIVVAERTHYQVFPEPADVFRAYELCQPDKVKVIILGQDPYHSPDTAHGLAFSHHERVKADQPSLKNIFKELEDDLEVFKVHHSPDLSRWAEQGVLLLNRILTVRRGQPLSHQNIGWELFTNQTIRILDGFSRPLVFVLWGKKAQEILPLLVNPIHKTLISPHPSPFSAHAGFFGSKPFTQINTFLNHHYGETINWTS